MKNLQQWLEENFPTKEQKERVKEIIIQGGVIDFSTNLPLSEEEANKIDGGKLDLSEYSNIEKVVINGYHLKTKLVEFNINNCANLTILNLSFNDLTDLNINNCPQLETFYCSHNKLTNLSFLSNFNPNNLVFLRIGNNNFYQDLSCFTEFTSLKHLEIDNSYFFGSLEHLYDLAQLELLNIDDTDIDSGLEYLPDNIKDFFCSTEEKANCSVKSIREKLNRCGEPEGYNENFANLLRAWKIANSEEVEIAKDIKNAEKRVTELNSELLHVQQAQIEVADKCRFL